MEAIENKRTDRNVNYVEAYSEDEEEGFNTSMVQEVIKEVVNDVENGSAYQLNKKKQYKKIVKSAKIRDDWEIDETKNSPKGNDKKDCYFFYLRFQPGVYRILIRDIIKILNDDFNIKLRSGRPVSYGDATIQSTCNFKLQIGEKERILQVRFYHTNNSFDLKVTGTPKAASEKFAELGLKNVAYFFIDDIMPEVIKRINIENNVESHKTYWSNLAKEGLANEIEKESLKAKEPVKKKQMAKKVTKVIKPLPRKKCGHCDKGRRQKKN